MLIFPEIVVFQDINFGGAEWRTNLGYSYVGDDWNDKISSVIVISGTWQFFEHANPSYSLHGRDSKTGMVQPAGIA